VALLVLVTVPAAAQTNYPQRNIRLIFGFPPSSDITTRLLADNLTHAALAYKLTGIKTPDLCSPFEVQRRRATGLSVECHILEGDQASTIRLGRLSLPLPIQPRHLLRRHMWAVNPQIVSSR
jgi:hypothetical protein